VKFGAHDGAVLLLAIAGAVTDLRTRRIPNRLTVTAMAAGLLLGIGAQAWGGLWQASSGVVIAFALLVLPFALGLVGAGDVKFLMAFGAFLGPLRTVEAFLWATAAGGLLAVAVLGVTHRGRARVLTSWIQFKNFIYTRDPSVLKPATHSDTIAVPYGLALALGAVTAQLGRGFLLG
jgi:prepilin peptidase CpaA